MLFSLAVNERKNSVLSIFPVNADLMKFFRVSINFMILRLNGNLINPSKFIQQYCNGSH